MPTMPPNFDGAKFANKYPGHSFRAEGNQLIAPTLPGLTDADLLDCVLTTEELADNAARVVALQQFRDEYLSALSTLQTIQTTTSPTNAQVIAAVKYEAKTLERMLRLLRRILA